MNTITKNPNKQQHVIQADYPTAMRMFFWKKKKNINMKLCQRLHAIAYLAL